MIRSQQPITRAANVLAYHDLVMRKYIKDSKIDSLTLKDYREKHPTYDAFENDIAIANFYFDKSTIIRFKRAQRMTWTDYISQIGGLLGLAIGFSFVSLVEILYWLFGRSLPTEIDLDVMREPHDVHHL